MSLDIVWAHFHGSGVTLEGGRSVDGGDDMGNAE